MKRRILSTFSLFLILVVNQVYADSIVGHIAKPGTDGSQPGVAWPNPRFTAGVQADGTACASNELVELDHLNGLMWIKAPSIKNTYIWDEAKEAAPKSYCGYTDWRLPNMVELGSLVNHDATSAAAWLNANGFVGIQIDKFYWTSDYAAFNGNQAFALQFQTGQDGATNKNELFYAIYVRGGIISK